MGFRRILSGVFLGVMAGLLAGLGLRVRGWPSPILFGLAALLLFWIGRDLIVASWDWEFLNKLIKEKPEAGAVDQHDPPDSDSERLDRAPSS